jgi:hypothetical protein
MTAAHARRSAAPFADRLALARRLIAAGAPSAPVHLADQLGAAGEEARRLHDRMGALLPVLEPDRTWRQRIDPAPSTDVRALLVAAVLGCELDTCCHLRKGGPQPAFVLLPLRRIACQRCVAIVRRPPADSDDQCDVCERRGVATFFPFAVQLGPALLAGDACRACAGVLGISTMERSA